MNAQRVVVAVFPFVVAELVVPVADVQLFVVELAAAVCFLFVAELVVQVVDALHEVELVAVEAFLCYALFVVVGCHCFRDFFQIHLV